MSYQLEILLTKLSRPLILDGAIGSLLQQKGFKSDPILWMTNVNFENPNAVLNIHLDYINAGCDIITTNTFRTNPISLKRSNADLDIEKAVSQSVSIAKKAVEDKNVLIAGSNAPAEDCYQIKRNISYSDLEYNHKNHIDLLYKNNVDFILNETQSHWDEIEIICKHCNINNIPFVVSLFITEDLKILSGENLIEVIEMIKSYNPLLISFNCITEKVFNNIFNKVKLNFNWGFYLNVGNGNYYDVNIHCGIDEIKYSEIIKSSLILKPKLIGACCGSNPKHISAIKSLFYE